MQPTTHKDVTLALLPPSESFHPRRSDEVKRRRRRQVEEAAQGGAHEVDQVDMYRSVEVVSAEESGEKREKYFIYIFDGVRDKIGRFLQETGYS